MKEIYYKDLILIDVRENNESIVSLNTYAPGIKAVYIKKDMIDVLGPDIYTREKVAKMLARANDLVKESFGEDAQLSVVYGYRHPEVQKKYFEKRKEVHRKENPTATEEELLTITHNYVAVPDVAGHPTGGAVDLTVTIKDEPVDMGTDIADYDAGSKILVESEGITPEQKKNRDQLHAIMEEVGFAPFFGEWWHFSFGDREWAYFYDKEYALYDQVELTK